MSSANREEYEVRLSRRAAAYLSRVNNPFNSRIIGALRLLTINPKDENLDVKPLEGRSGEYRLRVGRYRIIYTINESDRTVNIATILPRGDVYK